jgi:hypothetical protein
MQPARAILLGGWLALGAVPGHAQLPAQPVEPAPAAALTPTGANVIVTSGPHKGEYQFTEPCLMASFSKRPMGISVVLH